MIIQLTFLFITLILIMINLYCLSLKLKHESNSKQYHNLDVIQTISAKLIIILLVGSQFLINKANINMIFTILFLVLIIVSVTEILLTIFEKKLKSKIYHQNILLLNLFGLILTVIIFISF